MIRLSTILTYILLIGTLLLGINACTAPNAKLQKKIEDIANQSEAKVGVAVIHLETGETTTVNNDHAYPTMSVYKFHLALKILSLVDEGKIDFDKEITVTQSDLQPDTHSPLRDEHPSGGDFAVSLRQLLEYTVSKSDNNTCDILFRMAGGTGEVDRYIKGLGIEDISIQQTEQEMHEKWENQYLNTTTPIATAELLKRFYTQDILNVKSREILWLMMVETTTGPDKIKGHLPPTPW